MRKFLFGISFFSLFLTTSCDVLTGILNDYGSTTGTGLSNTEITQGLKEALKEGARFASNSASGTDGFLDNSVIDIRILLPPELRKVESNIRKVPILGDKIIDDLITSMNRGAEQAAKEAAPIFIKAITSMTIKDAVNILKGEKDAATQYLRRTTYPQLEQKFEPIIEDALGDVGASRIYDNLQQGIKRYNDTPLVSDLEVNFRELPALESYATEKALDGLFKLVAIEEQKIRANPYAYGQRIIQRVFGSLRES
jgi:hypothetical protein